MYALLTGEALEVWCTRFCVELDRFKVEISPGVTFLFGPIMKRLVRTNGSLLALNVRKKVITE